MKNAHWHEQLSAAYENYVGQQKRFMDKTGWKSSSDFPGGVVLWCKKIRGREVAVSLDEACNIQEAADCGL
jgi:hypothetical protein